MNSELITAFSKYFATSRHKEGCNVVKERGEKSSHCSTTVRQRGRNFQWRKNEVIITRKRKTDVQRWWCECMNEKVCLTKFCYGTFFFVDCFFPLFLLSIVAVAAAAGKPVIESRGTSAALGPRTPARRHVALCWRSTSTSAKEYTTKILLWFKLTVPFKLNIC
jgi:hypothetical protein